ncbi:MAG: PEP-CTERM sorting domain-containing protein [Opitutaceae bacterium]|jgi:hypothetical protein
MRILFYFSLMLSFAISLTAQTTNLWTDGGGGDPSWSNTANWSLNNVPGSSTDVQIAVQPSAGLIGIDTGATIIKSLTFNNTLTGSFSFELALGDTLQINGAITNNSGFNQSFNLPVNAGASATWLGPLTYSNIVNVGTNTITLSGGSAFAGSDLNFDITNVSTYGHFLGSGTATVTGVTINIGGSYAGSSGDTFDFTTGNFSGATLGSLPTLSGGLAWNTSSFLSSGLLSVAAIPEPSAYAALFGTAVIGFGVWRRRRKA